MDGLAKRLDQLTPLQRAAFALKEAQGKLEAIQKAQTEPVAIVGIACRFPGGVHGPADFWKLLATGTDAVGEIPRDRWDVDAYYDPDPRAPGKMNTRWGGFLDRIDEFDNTFFGISAQEAARIDPQQRLLLELAWESLEDAGAVPEQLGGSKTGVFVGISISEYGLILSSDLTLTDAFVGTGTSLSIAANRISYALDLRGPSVALDTACSSSLVGVHLACQSLRAGESRVALAGGVNMILTPTPLVNLTKAGFTAADGRCRSFDSGATGYVRSEGGAVVVLKTLSNALADHDNIYAVIAGSAVNQDGKSNGLTAPNRPAQEAVLKEAYASARVAPGKVQYVETQGTGTLLGDAIEVQAIGNVLGAERPAGHPLAIGSVKTNLGHLEAAAGMAGLLKVALALKHKAIPASLHFEKPNPHAPFDKLPIEVPTALKPWPAHEGPAVAGLSAFGFGGTNVHMVVQEAPVETGTNGVAPKVAPRTVHLLPISARNSAALKELAVRYRDLLASPESPTLAAVCATAALRRQHHDHRLAVVCSSREQAIDRLAAFIDGKTTDGWAAGVRPFGQSMPQVRLPGGPTLDETALAGFAKQYAEGHDLSWDQLYATDKPPVALPRYPWQRQRFWVDSDRYFPHSFGIGDQVHRKADGATAPTEPETDPTGEWLFQVTWQDKPLPAKDAQTGRWLLLTDAGGFGERVAEQLEKAGNACTRLKTGEWNRLEAVLMEHAATDSPNWVGILDLRACDTASDHLRSAKDLIAWQSRLCGGLSELIRRLVVVAGQASPRVWVVTKNAQAVAGKTAALSVAQTAVWGLGRTLALETPRHWGGLIDVGCESDAAAVVQQITAGDGEDQVAFRDRSRSVARLSRVEHAAAPEPFAFRADGTYLLTGGLGGLGPVVARWMVEQGARRLLVWGRTALPPRTEWGAVAKDSPLARKIAAVRELESLGASVHLAAVDVADETTVRAALEQFRAEGWPALRGVVHLADDMTFATVGGLTDDHYQHLFRAKLGGAWALHRALADTALDCFVLFSSSAAVLPSPLMGGFGAANAALDALAEFRQSQGLPATCVGWSDWSQQSLVDRVLKEHKMKASRNLKGSANRAALAILRRALDERRATPVVIPFTPEDWLRRPATPIESTVREEMARREPKAAAVRPRPELSTPFVAPATEVERYMGDLWQGALKLDRVGLHDNFFELGGDSLQGAVLLNRIQEHLREVIHPHILFENQTIDSFAKYLRKEHPAALRRLFPTEQAGAAEEWDADWPASIEEPDVDRAREMVATFVPRKDPTPVTGKKNPRAIFVLSPPRSGSTLFRVMLAGHPKLFAPPELEMLAFETLADRAAAYGQMSSSWLEGADRALMELKGYPAEDARARMIEMEKTGVTTKDFYKLLQDACAPRTLVDKTPSNAAHVKALRRAEAMFDDAVYIHLLRHPCAMILSYVEYKMHQTYVNRYGFDKKFPFAPRQMAELVWIISNRNILTFLDQVPKGRHCQVRFEELVSRPEETLRALCGSLGLEFDPRMAQPYKDKEKRMTSGTSPEKRMHGDQKFLIAHQSVDPTVADRWRAEMSADVLGNPAREMAALLGYTDVPSPEIRKGMGAAAAPAAIDQMSEDDVDSLLKSMLLESEGSQS